MKKLVVILVLLFVGITSLHAQIETCDCKADLDFIVGKIKKMPSYKKQVKGDKATQFESLYLELASQMTKSITIEACYKMLLQQMLLIKDVHASLKVNTAFLPKKYLEDSETLKSFKESEVFKNHPKTERNLSALKTALSKKPVEDKEGIYSFGKDEKIGVYLEENKRDFVGVLLETNLEHWLPGEIRFYLYHTNGNKYNMYFYDANTKTPRLVKSLSFENGRIWSYKKQGNAYNYELPTEEVEVASFKQLSPDVQYLYFATFSNNKRKKLKAFIDETIPNLTADTIIVDLRSNSGGNSKYSDPFVKALKNKNVYVITNCFTGSNGEQFTLKLLKNKNATHVGQTTRGIISYGMNYGYSYDTPSGHFKITPTDMNFHKYINYEGKGIKPEIDLDFNKDWIEQTLEIIEAN